MKKKVSRFVLVTLFLLIIPVSVLAHPGRTDSNGGHYNRSTGKYHYHHGYPEHQHPNGVCPYEKKTSSDTTTKTTTKATAESSPSRSAEDVPIKKMPTDQGDTLSFQEIVNIVVLVIIIALVIFCFGDSLIDHVFHKSKDPSSSVSPSSDCLNSEEQPSPRISLTQDELLVILDFVDRVSHESGNSFQKKYLLYLSRLDPDGWSRLEQSEKERDDQQC